MRLDKDICLGGRYNGKIIRRIKYNGYYIYPNTYSKYNIYEVEIPNDNTTIYLDSTDRIGLPQVEVFYDFGDGVANPTVGSITLTEYDENINPIKNTYVTYTYAKAGNYQIKTTEFLYDFYHGYLKSVIALRSDLKDASYLFANNNSLTSFENAQVESLDEINNMNYMFNRCGNLETVIFAETDFPDLTTMEWMFSGCENLDTVDFSYCFLPNVSSIDSIFASSPRLKNVNFSHCNLSSITSLLGAFYGGTVRSHAQSVDFSYCDLSGLTTLEQAFELSPTVTVDFSNANLSNVTSLSNTFNLSSLKHLNLSGITFGTITNMEFAFAGCPLLEEIDLSMLDTSNVTDMSGLFVQCPLLESVDIRNFDLTSIVINREGSGVQVMFSECPKLHTIRLDNCSKNTIEKIIESYGFPTGEIEGMPRRIYCKQASANGLITPDGWQFEYID